MTEEQRNTRRRTPRTSIITYITKVYKTDVKFSLTSKKVLSDLVRTAYIEIRKATSQLMESVNQKNQNKKTIKTRDIELAMSMVFSQGSFVKDAKERAQKVVLKFNNTLGQKLSGEKKKVSMSERAGLLLPVGRFRAMMKNDNIAERVSPAAAVYLTSVLQSLLQDLIEAADKHRKRNDSRFTSRAVLLGLHDKEIIDKIGESNIFTNSILRESGVPVFDETTSSKNHSSRKGSSKSRKGSSKSLKGSSKSKNDMEIDVEVHMNPKTETIKSVDGEIVTQKQSSKKKTSKRRSSSKKPRRTASKRRSSSKKPRRTASKRRTSSKKPRRTASKRRTSSKKQRKTMEIDVDIHVNKNSEKVNKVEAQVAGSKHRVSSLKKAGSKKQRHS